MKMFPKRNQSLWLSLVLTCQVALFGIVFFCRGFLLQKLLIPDVNNLPTDHGKPMWDQVVLLIIDALKYDFMSSIGLTEVYAFSEHNTSHSKFYKFVADPPTTTLQRLKSMTTGTLPTFIEAALNFGGSEITEDNIIDQLLRQKSNIIQMGDDTWDSIFPERFLRSYPYPSFDVWDLDTVDRGVERQIFDELKKKDWKLLIAHCLGVDHAGHRYGPNHQEMKRKLKEMDVFVRLVMENLPPNSLLLVFGDHGMTSTGDHGGDTNDEVNAALFAYSNSHPFTNDTNREIPQVDLVPTLSVLFGIPIPFSNIGRVVKGLLPLSPKDKFYSLALYQNIAQVRQYLEKYVSYAPSAMKGLELEKFFFRVDRVKEAPNINEAEKVLKIIQGKFRETCTQFNVYFILIGCFLSAIINDVIFLVLLSWHGFFSGRNATFSSIQWNAAFIGSFFPGETGISKVLKYVAQGVKVSVATFGFQIIYASVAGYRLPLEQSHFFISATILRLSCSMVSCFILRRHLMTWKIFAPRFIFEGLGTLISMVFCLAGSFLKLVEINRKRRYASNYIA
ncbi:uncharacterized protein LOC136033694 isoform X6 [Artemia franciscana]|uniref:uncharacterized protein LOC136033694 isoform X6 n=1 Tax=Artemia franciscana TaxID=6661 RepID=UPI0032DA3BBE